MIFSGLYLWFVLHWHSILACIIIVLLLVIGILLIGLFLYLFRYKTLTLKITSPSEGESVDYEQVVMGYITIPNIPLLQAWVFSGDNQWHLQAPVEGDGHTWRVLCKIGLKDNSRPDNNPTGEHKIAVTLGKKLKGPTRPDLSEASVKSNSVRVIRRK